MISNIRIGLFILAIVFIVLVFFYWRNEELYEEKKQRIRKTWYGLFITSVTVYFMIKGIDLTLWKNLLMFTAMVIFVDIAFILTPNISEIWGAKFSDIGKTVQSIKTVINCFKSKRRNIYDNYSKCESSSIWDNGMAYGRGIYKKLKRIFRFIWGKNWCENCCI